MHDEPDFLKDCVITEVSDDYENFEMVLKRTKHLAASREELKQAKPQWLKRSNVRSLKDL
jgi:hypothetical protein